MRKLTTPLLSLLVLATASARVEVPDEEIRVEELRAHVGVLAGDAMSGRRPGTPGGAAAAAWLAERFGEIGLEPGGEEGTFFSWVSAGGRRPDPESSAFRLRPRRGRTRSFTLTEDWEPFSFSGSGKLERVGVIFAGHGLQVTELPYDDYAGLDVEGKVVMILRRGPDEDRFGGPRQRLLSFETKARTAERLGAAAVLQVDDRTHHPEDADQMPTRFALRSGLLKIPYLFVKREVAEAICKAGGLDLTHREKQIARTGEPASEELRGVALDLELTMRSAKAPNVVGILPGRDPELATEVVVAGAHYDHLGTDGAGGLPEKDPDGIWNGADDNASGTALLVELAESLALSEPGPARTVVFVAFTGEELGLLGSGHYVRKPARPLSHTVAMFNFDMVGRSRGGAVSLGGTGTSKVFAGLIDAAEKESGLKVRRNPSGFAPSDSLHFARKKIPTLFFFTGIHPDYHRTTDEADRLDYGSMHRIAGLADTLLRAVADLPERPAYFEVPRAGASGAYLGIMPGAADAAPGILVATVMQASPAARGGLMDGDRIIALDGQKMNSMPVLRRALAGMKPGRKIEVLVRRGEETLTLPVTLVGR